MLTKSSQVIEKQNETESNLVGGTQNISIRPRKLAENIEDMHNPRCFSCFLVLELMVSSRFCLAFSPIASRYSKPLNSCLFSAATSGLPDGIIKTISTVGEGKPVMLGDIATLKYSCYLPTDETALPFARADNQKMV